MWLAHRSKVAPLQPQIGTLTYGLDVIDNGSFAIAAIDVACRVLQQEAITQLAPFGIVATSRRWEPAFVYSALALGLTPGSEGRS
jgi:hypothetical protein